MFSFLKTRLKPKSINNRFISNFINLMKRKNTISATYKAMAVGWQRSSSTFLSNDFHTQLWEPALIWITWLKILNVLTQHYCNEKIHHLIWCKQAWWGNKIAWALTVATTSSNSFLHYEHKIKDISQDCKNFTKFLPSYTAIYTISYLESSALSFLQIQIRIL